ncbi:GNAT family N-acetyltransferase [Novosphingobium sp. FSW06-99]|uniref:GNAT family N-acetyltransferase n=1 Tax=Novosphingobium sp. FSW06-99 TaxID=1739113 RepID=UPI00076D1618|nr:GNAT family N-acetyltransferase [Novosphingobium sp. FSW06-99]KUR78116.1 hypothetical protein AQZ49_08865 [Novosphingobium sp. FSW06-99]
MFIRSERLFLRPAWPEDWSDIQTALGDHAHVLAARPQAWRHPQFLITLPDQHGAHVVGLICFAPYQGETELGVWIAQHARGQGYATEAARAALTLARMLGHCRLVASPIADCPASARVLAGLGFAPTGQRRGLAREVHALDLCAPADDPVDPDMLRRAA